MARWQPDDGPLIAFSTLACPEWDARRTVVEGAAIGYDAIEWRGGPDGHVRPAWTTVQRRELRQLMADEGVQALAVTTYTSFVGPEQADRARNVEELLRYIELARDLGAGCVRAFAGIREDDAPVEELYRRVASALAGVADMAVEAGVVIGIEQHDDFDRAAQVGEILDLIDRPGIGAVWDVANGWSGGEAPDAGLAAIRGRVCYAQLKDGSGPREEWRACAFGRGDVPLDAAVQALVAMEDRVPISVEWLRAWDPTLAPPEIALPETLHYVQALVAAAAAARA